MRKAGAAGGALLGAAFFVWVSGWRILDPREIGWMMRFDWPIHFFGWHFFRTEPWSWPPGLIHAYYYPLGTSIGFTDSVPLMAFLLKPMQALLPATFQYLGVWLLICFGLQGLFGALIARIWTGRVPAQLAGAALFVLMPTLLIRVGHPALCAHWLLLWAFWIALRQDGAGPRAWEWAALGLLAGLIHPYLAVMTLALLGAAAIDCAGAPWARRSTAMIGALAATIGGWWMSGLFSVAGAESLATEGLGHYSMNLLSPMSPTGGWSSMLPDWPRATAGQDYEGFQYLGAGAFALLIAAIALRLSKTPPPSFPEAGATEASGAGRVPLALTIVALIMTIYALSPRVTLGTAVLLDWSSAMPERFAVFRATGRFFWPLGYLILIAAVAAVATRARPAVATATLTAAALLQLVDLHGAHLERRRNARDAAFHAWPQPMVSAAWAAALPHYDHLVLYPPPQCGPSPMAYEPAAWVAGLHRLTINAGGVARPDIAARLAYCHDLGDAVKAGRIDERSFYIMLPSEVPALRARAAPPVVCGVIDTLSVCVTAASYQRWRAAASLD